MTDPRHLEEAIGCVLYGVRAQRVQVESLMRVALELGSVLEAHLESAQATEASLAQLLDEVRVAAEGALDAYPARVMQIMGRWYAEHVTRAGSESGRPKT